MGQSIELCWATWRIRLRAFDPAIFQRWIQIVLPESRPVRKRQNLDQIGAAQFVAADGLEQQGYLVGYMVVYLIGRNSFADSIVQGIQYKHYKRCRISALICFSQAAQF